MLPNCPFCKKPLPSHGTCCRVPGDLDRFEKIYHRLHDDHHNPFLERSLYRHLVAFGRFNESDPR